jgi:hypothetical protein
VHRQHFAPALLERGNAIDILFDLAGKGVAIDVLSFRLELNDGSPSPRVRELLFDNGELRAKLLPLLPAA